MKTIRYGTFETNSSSCHSLILVKKDDFEKFKNHEMVLHMGGFGISNELLTKRGWQPEGGQDGMLLTWQNARDEYVKWIKEEGSFGENRIRDLRYIDKNFRKADDLTVEAFKEAILTGKKKSFIFGDFKSYEQWEEGYSDWDNPMPSTWSVNSDGLVEMETNWRDG